MTNHSVDILTNGRWVLVGNVQRWQGEHLEAPQPPINPEPQPTRNFLNYRGECACGEPVYSSHPQTRYCIECRAEARRATWRRNRLRRKAKVA